MWYDSVSLPDLAATERLALHLAPQLQRGDVIALHGPLGAGKTAFARGLLRALDVQDDVPSPTFTLIQTYTTTAFSIAHFDLYRIKNVMELDELGWDDALAEGVVLVEWPERAEKRIPDNHLALHFILDENDQRTCVIEPHGRWVQRLKAPA